MVLGEGCVVLIRAIQPEQSSTTVTVMTKHRQAKRKSNKKLKVKDLCSGPSKLTQAFKIDKNTFNQTHVCDSNDLWLEEGQTISDDNIVQCPRIGIDYAQEWKSKPLRFYVRANENVSVRDKTAEN